MKEVAIVIPNYNGMQYLETCLSSLERQSFREFNIYLVDNGSTDQSRSFVSGRFPGVQWIQLDQNYGFSRAVNEGILRSEEPYVILLNNDTQAEETFVEEILQGIRRHPKAFSAGAKMLSWQERDKIDDAGNYYNMLGWAFARGKGKPEENTGRSRRFSRPARARRFTGENCWRRQDCLTRSISLIWKIWISVTGPGFWDMRTGFSRKRAYIMWAAVPAVPDTIFSRSAIHRETISI